MSNTRNWLSIITNNELHAYNKVNSRGLAICFNFIQIPDTDTVLMTATIMKNKVKKNSLNPKSFAAVMKIIEDSLESAYQNYQCKDKTDEVHFVNVKSILSKQWYIQMCCHRIFFFPEDSLWSVVENLFHQENITCMRNNDIEEVTVYVNTENYDFNGKFY